MSKNKMNGRKDERARLWTFVVYPESTPENWREIMDELHIQWIESPLHEFDTNADGEVKKSHIHVVITFVGNKSFEQVEEITKSLNAPIPQKVASLTGVVRYMAHMDNPEKHQYNPKDIKGHGGIDVAKLLKPTSASRYECIREMMAYIRTNGITEISDLLDYAGQERMDDWFILLCDNSAYIIGEYIKSCRHKKGG